jgi:hypothetical protein
MIAIAERHANPGIHTNPFEGRSSLLGRLGELLAAWLLALVFGFLGRPLRSTLVNSAATRHPSDGGRLATFAPIEWIEPTPSLPAS